MYRTRVRGPAANFVVMSIGHQRIRRTPKLTKSVTLPDRDTLSTHTPVSDVQRLARRTNRGLAARLSRARDGASERSGSRLGSEDRGPTRQAVTREHIVDLPHGPGWVRPHFCGADLLAA